MVQVISLAKNKNFCNSKDSGVDGEQQSWRIELLALSP